MAKINIDNVEYDTESLSQEAPAQLQFIQFVDSQLARLQGQTVAMNTARIAYANAHKELLPKEGEEQESTAS